MTRLLLLFLLCLSVAAHAGEAPRPEFAMTATGDLEIGPDGGVRSWKMDSAKLGASVESLLQRNVERWRFEPVKVDGNPVIAKTRMSIELTAVPHGDGYLMKVNHVYFGSLKPRGDRAMPRYPAAAIRERLGARVLLLVKLDAEGNVVEAHPYQTSLSKRGREKHVERWRELFAQASVAAVSQWKYEPSEVAGGIKASHVMFVPIVYQAVEQGRRPDNRWQGYVPGPVKPAPWVDAQSLAQVDPAGLGDGQAAAVDSPFKLRSKVVGEVL